MNLLLVSLTILDFNYIDIHHICPVQYYIYKEIRYNWLGQRSFLQYKVTSLEYNGVNPFLCSVLVSTKEGIVYVSGEGKTCYGFLP